MTAELNHLGQPIGPHLPDWKVPSWPSQHTMQDLTALDGSNGFVVTGADENGEIIFSGAFVGDMNGDAVDDLLLGSYQFGQLGPGLGTLYGLFGSDQGFDEIVHVSTLDGSNGFTIFGDEGAGESIVPAGDINNDGRADVLIGAATNSLTGVGGKAYVLFGDSNAPPLVDLSELNGQNGFVVPGDMDNCDITDAREPLGGAWGGLRISTGKHHYSGTAWS